MQQQYEILEEDLDLDYEPSYQGFLIISFSNSYFLDILEYAEYLGMSPKSDQKYFYIAKKGLQTPVPHPWKPAKAPDGQIVYINLNTKEIREDHPLDELFNYLRKQYIEAKKKDFHTPGKSSHKLHNLVQTNRTDDNTQTTNKGQVKKKLNLDLLAGKSDASIDSYDLEDYEKSKKNEFDQYKKRKQAMHDQEVQLIQLNNSQDSIMENLSLKQSQFLTDQKEKQQNIKLRLQNEYENKLNNFIQEQEEDTKLRMDNYEQQMKYHIDKVLNDTSRQLQSKQNQKIIEINDLQTLFGKRLQEMELLKQKHITSINDKWMKAKQILNQRFQNQTQKEEEVMENQFKQKKENIVKDFIRLKKRKETELRNNEQSFQLDQKQKDIQSLYQQRKVLFQQTKLQEITTELKDEQNMLLLKFEDEIEQYAKRERLVKLSKYQQRQEKELSELNKFFYEQLAKFRQGVLKNQEIKIQVQFLYIQNNFFFKGIRTQKLVDLSSKQNSINSRCQTRYYIEFENLRD